MSRKPYGMICPITRACELLEPRWTVAILVGIWSGAAKFNEIRREIGNISPSLLSKRLKELENLGLVERIDDAATGTVDYLRTEQAIALEPALTALANWAQRHIEAETAMNTTTVSNLMWNMRQNIILEELPMRRVVMQFRFSDEGLEYDTYWALVQPGAPIEICSSVPDIEVDLYLETNVLSFTGILLGRTSIGKELELGELFLSGDAVLVRTMDRWLLRGHYAQLDGIKPLPDERRHTNAKSCSISLHASRHEIL